MQPLHRLPSSDIGDQPVSKHSTWASKTWRFPDPTPGGCDAVLPWERKLPDGSCLLDPEWATFLNACKRLIWSLRTEPVVGKPMKVGTLTRWIVGFWFIVDWMSEAGYRDMGELDQNAIEEYVAYLKETKATGDDDDILSGQTILKYLMPFSHMWQQADVLTAAGVTAIPQVPFQGKAASVVAREIAAFTEGEIPSVDDDTFVSTVNEVSRWLAYKGADVIRLTDIVLDLRSKFKYWWLRSSDHGERFMRPELRDFAFSPDPETGVPWHAPLTEFDNPSGEIRNLISIMNVAGVIALQALIGMRISEVIGLDAEAPADGALPACVHIDSSTSGVFDIFYIKGRLFKTTTEWIEAKWVAGMRPKGEDYLPPPVQAVVLIERLFRRWRQAGAPVSLFMSIFSANGMPKGAENFRRLARGGPSVDQHNWIMQQVGITPSVRVTSHQWRKTFAKHVFRTDKRLLPAIALHYKHISLAMAESYVGNDLELIEDIDSEASRHTVDRLYEWAIGGKPAQGPTAKIIMERCASLGQRLGNYSDDEKRTEIQRIVEENGIRIWGLRHDDKPYGMCIFRPGVAFCRSVPVGPMQRPDMASVNPGLCPGCLSFAVDDEHAQFWADRYRKNTDLLSECAPEDIGIAMLVRKRVDQSRAVLGWLGGTTTENDHAA